jgi:hypothetical protein
MEAVLDMEPVDPELLTRLGKVVILGAQVESWLAMLLGTLLGANLGASGIVTNTLSISAQIKCIRALLSVHAHKEADTPDVSALLDRADEIRLERNELMHGLWNPQGCEPKTALVNTTSLYRAEIIRDRLVTVPDLDELIDEMESWIKDYATLGAKIGFPRNKNATQSIFVEQP